MYTLNCKGRLLVIDKPLVMGIINTTPDSFYEGSRFMGDTGVLKQAEQMLRAGADILVEYFQVAGDHVGGRKAGDI